jgi:hypothetical protein
MQNNTPKANALRLASQLRRFACLLESGKVEPDEVETTEYYELRVKLKPFDATLLGMQKDLRNELHSQAPPRS